MNMIGTAIVDYTNWLQMGICTPNTSGVTHSDLLVRQQIPQQSLI